MGALSLHVWSAPKQSIHWDAKNSSLVAMFALRQNGLNGFKERADVARLWAVLLGLGTKDFIR